MVQKTSQTAPVASKTDPAGDGFDGRILIIEARYYEDVADELVAGAVSELEGRGVPFDRIAVPGALEIPQALSAAVPLFEDVYVGAIVLGCVIRGETAHYDVVVTNTNHWVMDVAMTAMIPVGNGVLTVDTKEQAMARAKGGRTGKGGDAARACLRLVEIERSFAGQLS